jgi:hypothetical protein
MGPGSTLRGGLDNVNRARQLSAPGVVTRGSAIIKARVCLCGRKRLGWFRRLNRCNAARGFRGAFEAALAGYTRHGAKCRVMEVATMADGPLAYFFWRALDRLDYWLTQAKLWLADAGVWRVPQSALIARSRAVLAMILV